MGIIVSLITEAFGQSRNNYEKALEPASLAKGGGNYMFLNVASKGDSNTYLALTHDQFRGNQSNSVRLAQWVKDGSNQEQIFKVQTDRNISEECVVSCYGNNLLNWIITENSSLEIQGCPPSADEAPAVNQWRKWRFQIEQSSPNSRMYRIISKKDDLNGNDCLASNDAGLVVLKPRMDDDETQLWYLNSQ